MALFSTCYKLSFTPPILLITSTKLVSKTWRGTVASMPLYLTTAGEASPMHYGLGSHSPVEEEREAEDNNCVPL